MMKSLENIEQTLDKNFVVTEESYVSGFDPATKKGFQAKNTLYRIATLLKYGNNDYMIGHRVRIIYDNGVTLDWHWKETIPESAVIVEPLKIINN